MSAVWISATVIFLLDQWVLGKSLLHRSRQARELVELKRLVKNQTVEGLPTPAHSADYWRELWVFQTSPLVDREPCQAFNTPALLRNVSEHHVMNAILRVQLGWKG